MKHLCYRCKEQREMKLDILNDGPLAECLYRCETCNQCSYEACCYLQRKTEDRRKLWNWRDRKKEAEADLEHAIACNDLTKQKKARTRVSECEKKISLLG